MGLPRDLAQTLELDVARWGVKIFCLGETVAVPLFAHLREGCTVQVARNALDRVLRDEIRHRQFGWDLLDQMLQLAQAELIREQIQSDLPGMFAALKRDYGDCETSERGADDIDDEDRTWGLAPAAEYAAILQETFIKDYGPRFARREIDAASGWKLGH